ncbi:MAG: Rid family detoxifying hydrolase [PVC group bacterium]
MKEIIRPGNMPPAAGPYSPAVRANGLVFISGQLPVTPEGTMVEGGIREQAFQVLENLKSVLRGAGLTPAHVVKTTVYLENIADFSVVNEVYGKYFAQEPPARACVQVSALPKGAAIEIDAVAAI